MLSRMPTTPSETELSIATRYGQFESSIIPTAPSRTAIRHLPAPRAPLLRCRFLLSPPPIRLPGHRPARLQQLPGPTTRPEPTAFATIALPTKAQSGFLPAQSRACNGRDSKTPGDKLNSVCATA